MSSFEKIFRLNPLPRKFFLQDTLDVARSLLGKGLVIGRGNCATVAILVEVEAYLSKEDSASHSACGRTKRSWPMFEEGGICYVYLSYGINYCMNVVTAPAGKGEAVLLRAAQPIYGIKMMEERRGASNIRSLLSGPGKLTEALGVNMAFNGTRFDQPHFKLVDLGEAPGKIVSSPRIGISKAKELPYRFFVEGSPWLSRKGV